MSKTVVERHCVVVEEGTERRYMSRTVLEAYWGSVGLIDQEAPAAAEELLTECAPKLLDYLVDQPHWHSEVHLHAVAWLTDREPFLLQKWKRLLWALEITGAVHIKTNEDGHLRIRISTAEWLRAVQKGTA